MSIREAYNSWAGQYDTNRNRTRDLESLALKKVLAPISIDHCLEVGCGTGKNSAWLIDRVHHLTGIDLSEEMLNRAKEKVVSPNATFKQADITKPWLWSNAQYDLITFSLVLEHIENLDHIFAEATRALQKDGYVYVGELHPFKQYTGTKARFETEAGTQIVECYNHHVSDFIQAARKQGLSIIALDEYFDENDRNTTPRILTILFQK